MENLISSLYEYNAVGKDQEVVTKRIYSLSERLSEIKMEIELLDVQMACVLDQRDKAVERIKFLRIQRDKGVRFLPPLLLCQVCFFLHQLVLKDLFLYRVCFAL